MFEKEAKEWVRTNSGYSTKEFHGQKAIEAFLAGAEFGYNKANEQLIKANEIIGGLMRFCRCFAQHHTEDIRYKEAEQFLRGLEE